MEKDKKEVKVEGKKVKRLTAAQLFVKEFKDFLNEYKILGIAAGLVIGSAVTTLTQSIVGGLIAPALQLLIPSESWKTLSFNVNGSVFQVGLVVTAIINFLVVALLFFIFVKLFLKKDKVTKDALS